MSFLQIENLTFRYERGVPVLKELNLEVSEGEFLSLLGPSGCGKTTLLRIIMGFLMPEKGRIILKGTDITKRPPHKRNFGIVFQSYALFPHMTVFENVAFGLRMRKLPKHEIQERVSQVLELVGLKGFEKRLPRQLSGGQAQRVAVARALAIRPVILLFDEPLSNLDAKLRERMRWELRAMQKNLGITSVYVTHDQIEALSLSDRIAVMNDGRIEQIGKANEIYSTPQTLFVADFMGFTNRIEATVVKCEGEIVYLDANGTKMLARCSKYTPAIGEKIVAVARPSAVKIIPMRELRIPEQSVAGTIRTKAFQGESILYVVDTNVGEMTVLVGTGQSEIDEGQRVFITIAPQHLLVLPNKKEV